MPGTPIPQKAFLTQLLFQKLSQPKYSNLFAKLQADQTVETATRQAAFAAFTAKHGVAPTKGRRLPVSKTIEEYAAGSVDYAFGPANAPKIVDPIVVVDLGDQRPLTLYRVFDGNVAKTLGAWWCSEALVKQVASNPEFAALRGDDRASAVCQRLAQLMFVHPTWNNSRYLAKMELGNGMTTAALAARGDWQALNAVEGFKGPEELPALGMSQGPGAVQYFIPLLDPMYVTKVPNALENWPFS